MVAKTDWVNNNGVTTPVPGVDQVLATHLNALGTEVNTKIDGVSPTINNPTINAYTEGVVAIGSTGTSKVISLAVGTMQTATLTGNCTFTMPTATAGKSFSMLLNTGTGGFTATFTGAKWPGATPVVTVTANKADLFNFACFVTGTWIGTAVQGYTP